ncbi:hypothetical protein [Streptomyces sp. NPDC056255]|uniref:hypothetical protein n=1 Tax=Streptomyces sp. NPDC056255 TaxID=3345764 RepID=UPI0035DB2034
MHSRTPVRRHAWLKGAAAAVLLGVAVLPAAPAQADTRTAASWKCGGGLVSVPSNPDYYTAWCKKGSASVRVDFTPTAGDRKEYVHVRDHFANDRKTVAYLSVKGEGVARFTTGSYTRDYPEGRDAALMVCTSGSAKAVCSDWEDGGIT